MPGSIVHDQPMLALVVGLLNVVPQGPEGFVSNREARVTEHASKPDRQSTGWPNISAFRSAFTDGQWAPWHRPPETPWIVLHPHVATRVVQELRGACREMPNPFAELTDRELEVLRLVAEGLSNAEIAERLVLSVKTVKGYVSNILSRLFLADRTQAAVFAWREGMMRSD